MNEKKLLIERLCKYIHSHYETILQNKHYTTEDKLEALLYLFFNILDNTTTLDFDFEFYVKTIEGKTIKISDEFLQDIWFDYLNNNEEKEETEDDDYYE